MGIFDFFKSKKNDESFDSRKKDWGEILKEGQEKKDEEERLRKEMVWIEEPYINRTKIKMQISFFKDSKISLETLELVKKRLLFLHKKSELNKLILDFFIQHMGILLKMLKENEVGLSVGLTRADLIFFRIQLRILNGSNELEKFNDWDRVKQMQYGYGDDFSSYDERRAYKDYYNEQFKDVNELINRNKKFKPENSFFSDLKGFKYKGVLGEKLYYKEKLIQDKIKSKKKSLTVNKDWVNKSPKKKQLLEFEESINAFLEKMQNPSIKPWYEIVQKRGEGQAAMADVSSAVKEDDYNYWAEGHLEEYLLRINSKDEDMRLDKEAFLLRIKVFSEIIDGLEVVIKKAADLELNITKEMAIDYHAAVASKLGAEMALKKIN